MMIGKGLLLVLVSLTLPTLAIAYPAPRQQELPQKAHGYLGLDLTLDSHLQIAYVCGIQKDSPAELAGLRRWDVIVEIDERPIDDPLTVLDRIASCRPGTLVPITVLRGNELVVLFARMGCHTATQADAQTDRVMITINAEEPERQTGVVEGVGEEFLQ
jgi:C-terminal processing protease CtpA/Prc